MRKDISPEMYNYNKYPGPIFVTVGTIVKSEGIELTLLDNYKNAFDAEVFGQRFSEWLLKYDYIVGDWGNEQLRLKGFYKDDRQATNLFNISRLDDYLKEYCAFGCAYFVLENKSPKESFADDEEPIKRRRKRRRKPSGKPNKDYKMSSIDRGKQDKVHHKEFDREIQEARHHFTIRKKEN